jgi:hypothetical protein
MTKIQKETTTDPALTPETPKPETPESSADPTASALNPAQNDPRVEQAAGIFANLAALEMTPTSQIAVREVLSVIAIRRPKDNEFVRASEFSLTTFVWEDKDEGETYFVVPSMRPHIIAGGSMKLLVLAVNQIATPFIWKVPVVDEYSRRNTWNESHRDIYQTAKKEWVKMVGDRGAGLYRKYLPSGDLQQPRFPDRPFNELLDIAFRGRLIDREDHPIIKAMRGIK